MIGFTKFSGRLGKLGCNGPFRAGIFKKLDMAIHKQDVTSAGNMVEMLDMAQLVPHNGNVRLRHGAAGRIVNISYEKSLDTFPQPHYCVGTRR